MRLQRKKGYAAKHHLQLARGVSVMGVISQNWANLFGCPVVLEKQNVWQIPVLQGFLKNHWTMTCSERVYVLYINVRGWVWTCKILGLRVLPTSGPRQILKACFELFSFNLALRTWCERAGDPGQIEHNKYLEDEMKIKDTKEINRKRRSNGLKCITTRGK